MNKNSARATSCMAIIFLMAFSCKAPGTSGQSANPPSDNPDSPTSPTPVAYQQAMGDGFTTDWFKGDKLGKKYTPASLQKTIRDLYSAGFRNLRLRSRADIWGFPDDNPTTFQAASRIDQTKMDTYLDEMERVVDVMTPGNMYPVISWIHHHAEGRANAQDGNNFVAWWTAVAERLKDKDYKLSFNLMTEAGDQDPDGDGISGIYGKIAAYNDWTLRTIQAIRNTGSKNANRILIITAPQNTKTDSLSNISQAVLDEDNLMVEYHSYAAGPATNSRRNPWNGMGSSREKEKLTDRLDALRIFTTNTGLPVYWGAWMPKDNKTYTLSQAESEAFGEFFAAKLKEYGIPWALNKLRDYYDYGTNTWVDIDMDNDAWVRAKSSRAGTSLCAAANLAAIQRGRGGP